MKEQKDRAKADAKSKKSGHTDVSVYRAIADKSGKTEFLGYSNISSESKLTGILVDGVGVSSAAQGDDVEIILNRTPFYAEGGGQLADGGRITLSSGAVIEIDDVQAPVPGVSVHRGRVISGTVEVGSDALAEIDAERRSAISRAPVSYTHLTLPTRHQRFEYHSLEFARNFLLQKRSPLKFDSYQKSVQDTGEPLHRSLQQLIQT